MAQTSQTSQTTLINLPPPASNPETPSETPGTPTSTTTSLSALSTTAIKDGHRGGHLPGNPFDRGHAHNPSITSLEAERADRISRLAGLERVSALPPHSPQTTPTTSTAAHLTPAYFDSNGQPVAVTKISTVGTASATDSHLGERHDEDILSTDTNYREAEAGSVASDAGERMSDDGSSLVGWGEGAGSTVSGPIYARRPGPHQRSGSAVEQERREARMVDGVADTGGEGDWVDTTFRGGVPARRGGHSPARGD